MNAGRLLITGASRGIGRAVAESLTTSTESLVLTARSGEALGELVQHRPGALTAFVCDLVNPVARRELVAMVRALDPPLDGLIHCAGDGLPSAFEATESVELRRLFELHVVAPFELAQALLPGMRHLGGGRIIAVSSLAAIRPRRFMAAYASTKAALRTMIQCLADEVAVHNITANIISPGGVETDLGRRGRAALEVLQGREPGAEIGGRIASLPIGRPLIPEDLTATIRFLLGPGGDAISGQDIIVAGTTVMR